MSLSYQRYIAVTTDKHVTESSFITYTGDLGKDLPIKDRIEAGRVLAMAREIYLECENLLKIKGRVVFSLTTASPPARPCAQPMTRYASNILDVTRLRRDRSQKYLN